jgi:hypothetical protein
MSSPPLSIPGAAASHHVGEMVHCVLETLVGVLVRRHEAAGKRQCYSQSQSDVFDGALNFGFVHHFQRRRHHTAHRRRRSHYHSSWSQEAAEGTVQELGPKSGITRLLAWIRRDEVARVARESKEGGDVKPQASASLMLYPLLLVHLPPQQLAAYYSAYMSQMAEVRVPQTAGLWAAQSHLVALQPPNNTPSATTPNGLLEDSSDGGSAQRLRQTLYNATAWDGQPLDEDRQLKTHVTLPLQYPPPIKSQFFHPRGPSHLRYFHVVIPPSRWPGVGET